MVTPFEHRNSAENLPMTLEARVYMAKCVLLSETKAEVPLLNILLATVSRCSYESRSVAQTMAVNIQPFLGRYPSHG